MTDPTSVTLVFPHWMVVASHWVGGGIIGLIIGCLYTDWKRDTFA